AVLAEAGEEALRAVRIDVAGLRIAGQVRPADTADVDVGEEDAEPVRPDNLAGVGVEAHHALASGGAFAAGIDDVDVLALHQGRGPAAKLRFPDQVVIGRLLVRRPAVGQVLLARNAVLLRPAPVQPVAGRGVHHRDTEGTENCGETSNGGTHAP